MFKIYKRTIGTPEQTQRLSSTEYYAQEKSISRGISNVLAIPAMIAGAVVGTLVFSVYFCRAVDSNGNPRLQSVANDEKCKTTSHRSKHYG